MKKPRIWREWEATKGIGHPRRAFVVLLVIMSVSAWFFDNGNFIAGLIVIGWYGLAARSRFLGPCLGIELEKWEDERGGELDE